MWCVGSVVGGATVSETVAQAGDFAVDGRVVLAGMGLLVRFVSEILKLYVKVIGPEDLAETKKRMEGVSVAAGVDQVADLALTAGGETDEPLGVRA